MTNPENSGDASASETISALEEEITEFSRQQANCSERIKKLMLEEDTDRGIVHAKEIFSLQQEKLRLEVEVQFRRNKINRLREEGQ